MSIISKNLSSGLFLELNVKLAKIVMEIDDIRIIGPARTKRKTTEKSLINLQGFALELNTTSRLPACSCDLGCICMIHHYQISKGITPIQQVSFITL